MQPQLATINQNIFKPWQPRVNFQLSFYSIEVYKFFIHYHKTSRVVNIKRYSAELIDAAFVILPIELFTFHGIKFKSQTIFQFQAY